MPPFGGLRTVRNGATIAARSGRIAGRVTGRTAMAKGQMRKAKEKKKPKADKNKKKKSGIAPAPVGGAGQASSNPFAKKSG
jgi:hypothetical protein